MIARPGCKDSEVQVAGARGGRARPGARALALVVRAVRRGRQAAQAAAARGVYKQGRV